METGNMRYAADKPEKCTDCYFWHKRKGCCEREISYYLVEQEKEQEPDAMHGGCRFALMGDISPFTTSRKRSNIRFAVCRSCFLRSRYLRSCQRMPNCCMGFCLDRMQFSMWNG